jgi:carbon storage regulator
MLKLSLKPGEFIQLGEDIRIVFSGGSANNIHLLVDAPKEVAIARSNAGKGRSKSSYYKEKGISQEAQREITEILMREKHRQSSGMAASNEEKPHQRYYTAH